jgi:hypothetical protein
MRDVDDEVPPVPVALLLVPDVVLPVVPVPDDDVLPLVPGVPR